MTSKGDDLEKELRQNLKLRRELQGEIAKAEAGEQLMHSRWLRACDAWLDFQDGKRTVGGVVLKTLVEWYRAIFFIPFSAFPLMGPCIEPSNFSFL